MNVLEVMKESAALHDDNGDLIAKAAMIKARDSVAELIEAVKETLECHPEAGRYVDSPCIAKADRDALKKALAKASP